MITDFLSDAEAGGLQSRVELRETRGSLAHVVASDLATLPVDAVRSRHVQTLVAELRADGLSASRAASVVEALRPVFVYAVGRGLIRTSPLVGLAPPRRESPTPTAAMLALGQRVVSWTVRLILIAFALAVVVLVVALR
jgi:site-specific recombinase XerC